MGNFFTIHVFLAGLSQGYFLLNHTAHDRRSDLGLLSKAVNDFIGNDLEVFNGPRDRERALRLKYYFLWQNHSRTFHILREDRKLCPGNLLEIFSLEKDSLDGYLVPRSLSVG